MTGGLLRYLSVILPDRIPMSKIMMIYEVPLSSPTVVFKERFRSNCAESTFVLIKVI